MAVRSSRYRVRNSSRRCWPNNAWNKIYNLQNSARPARIHKNCAYWFVHLAAATHHALMLLATFAAAAARVLSTMMYIDLIIQNVYVLKGLPLLSNAAVAFAFQTAMPAFSDASPRAR